MRILLTLVPLPLLLTSCGQSGAASPAELEFVDVAEAAGIIHPTICGDPRRWYIPESNGTGAAWLDHDGDGDLDLFVGNGGRLLYHDTEEGAELEVETPATARLYRNDGGLRFTDVTAEAGCTTTAWINGIAVGDVENDGDPDLYLAVFGGPDILLRNDGGSFVDVTQESGLGNELWGCAATFGDPDRDGDLDLFVANYVQFDVENPPAGGKRMIYEGVELGWGPEAENEFGYNPGSPNRYYENKGGGLFEEATEEAGLALERALCSYAAISTDVDRDGWSDLLVANDVQPTSLFHNNGDGTFSEQGAERGFASNAEAQYTAAMGLAVADVDLDGDLDVLRTNFDFEANCLHLNDGTGTFRDVAAARGLGAESMPRLGWGCSFFDAELDGDLDLLVANGHVLPQATEIGMSGWAQGSQLFRASNDEGRMTWTDASDQAGAGLAPLRSSRGLAMADVDDDGDLDALIVDIDHRPRLLENRSRRAGHWVSVRLQGTSSNRDGIGALVRVTADGTTWTRDMRRTDGLFSSNDPRLHFGLGEASSITAIEVTWPSGKVQRVESPELDSRIVITEPE